MTAHWKPGEHLQTVDAWVLFQRFQFNCHKNLEIKSSPDDSSCNQGRNSPIDVDIVGVQKFKSEQNRYLEVQYFKNLLDFTMYSWFDSNLV